MTQKRFGNHFVIFGLNEGRSDINSDFNVFAYSSAYPDLQKAFGDDLLAYYVHYVNFGIKENRKYTTIDATTKAGFTVSGMNGQILASPRLIVPSSVDNSSVSNILSSLTLPSFCRSNPSADTCTNTGADNTRTGDPLQS